MDKVQAKVVGVLGIIITLILSLQVFSYAAFTYQQVSVSPTGTNKVLVLVNSAIYSAIYDPSLKQYVADLEAEDYNVTLTKFISGTPQDLKNYFKSISGLKGVVLVGDFPVVYWKEYLSDYNGYTSYPFDLFYTDLNGSWEDTDQDGVYEKHSSDRTVVVPEIWIGRLTASTLFSSGMTEVAMLKSYFARNHAYRLGNRSLFQQRALSYWDTVTYYSNQLYIARAYDDITVVNTNTSVPDYTTKLAKNYEMVELICHSTVLAHVLGSEDMTGPQIPNPAALFYALKTCNTGRYTDYNYMAGYYIFSSSGLVSLAATSPSGAFAEGEFYEPLGANNRKNWGNAFKDNISSRIINYPYPDTELFPAGYSNLQWTLIGDPTLTLDPPIAKIGSVSPSTVEKGNTVTFTGSGSISKGSITGYSWRSSINGNLGSAATVSTSALSEGTHTIYLKVKDSKGRWSSEAQAALLVNPAAPKLTATVTDTKVVFKWVDSYTNESGFVLESSADNVTFQPVTQVAANITTYTLDGLPPTKMYFREFAFNSTGKFVNSNVVLVNPVPAAPSGLTATVSATNIVFKWVDNSSIESGYVFQSSTDNVTFQPLADFGANVTTYSFGGLPATKMYFRVFAYNSRLQSGYSNVVSASPVPAAPSGLTATVSATNVVFKWVDNSSIESGYVLQSSTDNVTFQPLADFGANVTTYSLGGLPATKMYFRVFAYNSRLQSAYSNVVFASPVPAAPSGLTATVSATNVVFKWVDNSSIESGYVIQSSTDNVTFQPLADFGANVTTYSLGGLPATKMYFRVFAYNSRLQSAYSNVVSANPVPAAPSGLTATVSATNVVFKWVDNSAIESGYVIQSSTDNVTFQPLADFGANVTTYSLGGLPATKMYFRVFAYNSRLQSAYSNVVFASPVPAAPSGLTATVSATNVVFKWVDNSSIESGYVIQSSTDNVIFQPLADFGANVTTYSFGGLPATKMYFRVFAYNSRLQSAYSNVVSANPVPAAPSGLTATVSATNVVFKWVDNSSIESGYVIQSSTDNVTFQPLADFGANVTTYSFGGLPARKMYFRVFAYNSRLQSAYSNAVLVDPLLKALTAS